MKNQNNWGFFSTWIIHCHYDNLYIFRINRTKDDKLNYGDYGTKKHQENESDKDSFS
jgi:hypothetical protein